MRFANKKRFGASSEKVREELMGQLSLMLNEAEVYAPPGRKVTEVAAHIRQRRSPRLEEALPENAPVEVVEHRLSEEKRECPICGESMAEIGKEVRRTLSSWLLRCAEDRLKPVYDKLWGGQSGAVIYSLIETAKKTAWTLMVIWRG